MPEPYKSEIDQWIKAETNIRRFHLHMALVNLIGMGLVAITFIGMAIHWLYTHR